MNNFSNKLLLSIKDIFSTDLTKISSYLQNFPEIEGLAELENSVINKTLLNESNNIILTINKFLWNSIELADIEWKDKLVDISLILFLSKNISKFHLLALIGQFKAKQLINSDFISLYSYLFFSQSNNDFKSWLNQIKSDSETLGTDFPTLAVIIANYEEFFTTEVDDYWNNLSSIIDSLEQRKEFNAEIIESCSDQELEDILPFVNWQEKKKITKIIVKRNLKKISNFKDDKEVNKVFNDSKTLKQLPVSYPVLEDKIQELPMTAITDKTFENVPQQLISKWAPKFVYSVSEPETNPQIQILFPGGKHIGHSGIIIKSKKGSLLLDFGMSVVNNSLPKWMPILDYVDAVLLSHAHGDHSGAVPLLMNNNPELPIISKTETKKLANILWHGNSSVISRNYPKSILKQDPVLRAIVNRKNINQAVDNFVEIKPKESISPFPGCEIKTWDASHLFGSVAFEITIGSKRMLYTGDFNADGTSIFPGSNFPTDVDSFIFDGTYYGREQNTQIYPTLKDVLKSSKRVLIPAFSLGRSQELLFQLKKMQAHKKWKIYMTGMGGRVTTDLNLATGMGQPTDKSGLHIVPRLEQDELFTEGSIVIAGQGMLQAGGSRSLLDYSANDEDTSVVFCGFQAPYSLGFNLQAGHSYLKEKYKQQIFRISMSGHTSPNTLNTILDNTSGHKIVVHAPDESDKLRKKEGIITPHELDPFILK